MLAFTLMLIALAAAAPRIAQQIKREREEELVHIGKDYATAVKRFVHKNGGRYPNSIEQLENTNHIRFLRKQYKDPTTGENNWRLVHTGEAEIKIPAPNPGLNPNSTNSGLGGPSSTSTGTTPNTTAPVLSAPSGPPQGTAGGNLGTLKTSNIGNGQQIGGGQIIGVASVNKAQSIKEFNDKDHYNEWFFVYDLRLEQAGGTGVTIAAPRAGAAGDSGSSGQSQPGITPGQIGTQPPASAPSPTPPPQVPQ
jgi:type II secretory pathway pseudopilin PulG